MLSCSFAKCRLIEISWHLPYSWIEWTSLPLLTVIAELGWCSTARFLMPATRSPVKRHLEISKILSMLSLSSCISTLRFWTCKLCQLNFSFVPCAPIRCAPQFHEPYSELNQRYPVNSSQDSWYKCNAQTFEDAYILNAPYEWELQGLQRQTILLRQEHNMSKVQIGVKKALPNSGFRGTSVNLAEVKTNKHSRATYTLLYQQWTRRPFGVSINSWAHGQRTQAGHKALQTLSHNGGNSTDSVLCRLIGSASSYNCSSSAMDSFPRQTGWEVTGTKRQVFSHGSYNVMTLQTCNHFPYMFT